MAELPPLVHEPETVRRAVEEVLSRPEFSLPEPSLWERFTGWISEQVGRVLEAVLGTGQAPALGTVLVVGSLLVALGILVWFSRGVLRGGGLRPETPPVARAGLAPQDWLDAAAAAERQQHWREALRCRYRWLVAELDRRGTVEEEDGRTAGEYLAEVRARAPAAGPTFEEATRAFESAWYGRGPVDGRAVETFRGTAEEVERAVGQRA